MITLGDLLVGLGAIGVQAPNPGQAFPHITQDSRDVQPGDLFVARRGEKMDGHAFIADALDRGAVAVLAERVPALPRALWIADLRGAAPALSVEARQGQPPVAYIVAPDSHKALERLAAWQRARLAVQVIGVTGSVGKTSTKEMIAAVLERRFTVLKSERSLNTDVGMAITLLQLGPEHQMAVLEMGMYGRNEIAHLCSLARPRYGVVTNVGPTHLERLGSIEAIAEAKAELVQALPDNGGAILNADDARVWEMRWGTKARITGYGLTPGLDVWASDVASQGLHGISFVLHHAGESAQVRSPLLGVHSVQTALAAAAVGFVVGMGWDDILAGLTTSPRQLRLVVVEAANGARIIDDSYNASPMSVSAALGLLSELAGRKVVVLGSMFELGTYAEEGHRLVGRRARQVADVLVAVGELGRLIGDEALKNGMAADKVTFAASNIEAIAALKRLTKPGDNVLIKGSRGMQMEEIVKGLT